MTAPALMAATGITRKQVDYWVRCGYLRPIHGAWRGSGTPHAFEPVEAICAAVLAQLVGPAQSINAARLAALELIRGGARVVLIEGGRACAYDTIERAIADITTTCTLIDVGRLPIREAAA